MSAKLRPFVEEVRKNTCCICLENRAIVEQQIRKVNVDSFPICSICSEEHYKAESILYFRWHISENVTSKVRLEEFTGEFSMNNTTVFTVDSNKTVNFESYCKNHYEEFSFVMKNYVGQTIGIKQMDEQLIIVYMDFELVFSLPNIQFSNRNNKCICRCPKDNDFCCVIDYIDLVSKHSDAWEIVNMSENIQKFF